MRNCAGDIQKRRNFEANVTHVNSQLFHCYMRCTHWSRSVSTHAPRGGGGHSRVLVVRGCAALTTPSFRPRFPFSRPPLRSISVLMPIKIVEWSCAIAHPARSPCLKTPENFSLHCSLANLKCMHVTEVDMYINVLHYPISFSAPS